MRKYVISSVVVLAVFISGLTVFGQPADKSEQQKEQIENIQQKWQNMSEEDKEKFRPNIQDRIATRGTSLEGQLEAVKTIEEHLVKLKAAIESMIRSRSEYQSATEEVKASYGKNMAETARARQQAITAIEKELTRLRYQRPRQQPPEPEMGVRELQMIYRMAVKEKATQTAKSLESLIAKTKKRESQTQGMEQGPRRGQTERTPRPRQREP